LCLCPPRVCCAIDECGLDESICRNYARAPIGEKVEEDITGKRTARTSIIAGLKQKNVLAPLYFQGYCNTEVILAWVKNELLPVLKAGLKVIWDNATFHKSSEIEVLIESIGCKLLFFTTLLTRPQSY
jgi:hypothetical protein